MKIHRNSVPLFALLTIVVLLLCNCKQKTVKTKTYTALVQILPPPGRKTIETEAIADIISRRLTGAGIRKSDISINPKPGNQLEVILRNSDKYNDLEYWQVNFLMGSSGRVDIWETYEATEIASYFFHANDTLKTLLRTHHPDSVSGFAIPGDTTHWNPLLEVLNPYFEKDDISGIPRLRGGPVFGFCNASDTARVMNALRLPQMQKCFPSNLILKWYPIFEEGKTDNTELLVCLRKEDNDFARLPDVRIAEARALSSIIGTNEKIRIQLHPSLKGRMAIISQSNINRSIGITIDGELYSYPKITGIFKQDEIEIVPDVDPRFIPDIAAAISTLRINEQLVLLSVREE